MAEPIQSNPDQEIALNFAAVGKKFQRQEEWSLRDFTLKLTGGSIHGLVGANGSGKSTAVRIAAGLVHATTGSVSILGIDSRSPRSRRSLVFVPEAPTFPKFLTGSEALEVWSRLGGSTSPGRSRLVAQALEWANLSPTIRIGHYSKGMRQRLALAVLLLGPKRVVILDEPGSDLDQASILRLRSTLREITRQGSTVLLTSHQVREAISLCDAVTILRAGSTVESQRLRDEADLDALKKKLVLLSTDPTG